METLTFGELVEIQRQPRLVIDWTKAAEPAFEVDGDVSPKGGPFPNFAGHRDALVFGRVAMKFVAAQDVHSAGGNLDAKAADDRVGEEIVSGGFVFEMRRFRGAR